MVVCYPIEAGEDSLSNDTIKTIGCICLSGTSVIQEDTANHMVKACRSP